MSSNEKLIVLDDVCKHFKVSGGMLKAVDHISLDIYKGETLGLVGESGCGKSTLGRVAMGIYPATSGKLYYAGEELNLKNAATRFKYAKKAQIIFQDPYASLDPRMTVSSIIEEGMVIHGMYDAKRRQERVYELLELVGLNKEHANRFPHEFSGGQRQRIGIARALAIEPEFIVCDEPISALDVSIQSQIINLLHDLQQQLGLTFLFIAHDLNIVKYISDRIAVMYLAMSLSSLLPTICTRTRCIRTPRLCFPQCRFRTRVQKRRSTARFFPATCRVRSTRRRAATLPAVARSPATSAESRSRSCVKFVRVISAPAIW